MTTRHANLLERHENHAGMVEIAGTGKAFKWIRGLSIQPNALMGINS